MKAVNTDRANEPAVEAAVRDVDRGLDLVQISSVLMLVPLSDLIRAERLFTEI